MTGARMETVVRGVLFVDDHVVLCRDRADGLYALIGGHVEHGERAEAALRREVLEETGRRLDAPLAFVAVIEHRFLWRGADIHEFNLVFAARLDASWRSVAAQEPQLEIELRPVSGLAGLALHPDPLPDLIARLFAGEGGGEGAPALHASAALIAGDAAP